MTSEEADMLDVLSVLLKYTTVAYKNSPVYDEYQVNGWDCSKKEFDAVNDWLERNGKSK